MGRYIVAAALLVASPVIAQPETEGLIVLEDRGGVSITKYTQSVTEKTGERAKAPPPSFHMANLFPVVTPSMSPGPVGAEEGPRLKKHNIIRPFFIIGDDPASLDWLAQNREMLTDKMAAGMVVNVQSAARMNAIRQIAGKAMILTAVSGEDISEKLNIRHYPFYMDQNGVMR